MKQALMILCTLFLLTNALASEAAPKDSAELFLIQSTKSATIKPIQGKSNQYLITLQNVEPYVGYLSDRPTRVFGYMTMQNYLNLWTNGVDNFQQSPPNVSIESALKSNLNEKLSIMGEITTPKYDAKKDTISYVLTTPKNNGKIQATELGYTIMLIDSALVHWNPGGFGA